MRNFLECLVIHVLWITLLKLSGSECFAQSNVSISAAEACRRSGLPCVLATYGPNSGMFVLDSGSQFSAAFGNQDLLDSPDSSWHVSTMHGIFTAGSGEIAAIANIPVSGFGLREKATKLAIIPKHDGSAGIAHIDGLLGLPEMRDLVLRIDLTNEVTENILQHHAIDARVSSTDLLNNSANMAQIYVMVAKDVGQPLLTVDTGGRFFLLLQSAKLKFYQRLGNAVAANKVTISTAKEIREVQTWILKSATVCGFEFLDVPVIESNFNSIGMGCFSHFDMVLDFPKNEMWLTPHSNEWPKRVPPDASGLVLGFLDTNVLKLLRIQPDSAASKSELQIDDQILLFDGKEPKDISMWEIQQRLTQAGTKLPLRIRRGDQELDLQLPLSYSFEYPPKWSNKKNELDEFKEFLEQEKPTPDSTPANQPK